MGGLLNNARKFLKGFSPALPARAQEFAVRCPEGHRVTGLRTEGYQALRCPTCSAAVFVLPRSPLPDPGSPPAKKATGGHAERSPRPSTGVGFPDPLDDAPVALTDPIPARRDLPDHLDAADAEIEWVDEGDAPPPSTPAPAGDPADFAAEELADTATTAAPEPAPAARPARPGPKRPTRPENERRRPREAEHVDPYADAAPIVAPPPRAPLDPAGWVRRNRNPLIFLGVGLVVAATIGVRVWRARLAELPGVAERGKTEGLAALDDGRFDTARELLLPARSAVDTLGDHTPEANAVRQGAKEVEVIIGLCPVTLSDLLDEAARSDPKEWAGRFDKLYRGRSVIVEAPIARVPDGQGRGGYELDLLILPPGEGNEPRSRARVDVANLKLLLDTSLKKGAVVTLGAKLAGFRYDSDREEWAAALEPDSGVFMLHQKALESLGVGPGDDPAEDDKP